MDNTIEYKGYVGTVEFSKTDKAFYGKVLDTKALISYEGQNTSELIKDFHNAINDYLKLTKIN